MLIFFFRLLLLQLACVAIIRWNFILKIDYEALMQTSKCVNSKSRQTEENTKKKEKNYVEEYKTYWIYLLSYHRGAIVIDWMKTKFLFFFFVCVFGYFFVSVFYFFIIIFWVNFAQFVIHSLSFWCIYWVLHGTHAARRRKEIRWNKYVMAKAKANKIRREKIEKG